MRKYYPGITLFKLIGSLLVVLTHIKLPLIYAQLNKNIAGLHNFVAVIVPCFYVVSGFLAYQGWFNSKNRHLYIRRYLMWIFSVYIIFFLFYIIEHTLPLFWHYGFIPHFLFDQFKDLLEKFFIKGPNPALWFVPPLFFGVIVSYYFITRKKIRLVIVLASSGFIFAQFLSGTLRVLLESFISSTANILNIHIIRLSVQYLGFGLPFVLTGVLLGKYETAFLQTKANLLWSITLASVLIEGIYLHYFVVGTYHYQLIFSMIPIAILTFYNILNIKADGIRQYHKFLNAYTIIIYFCHFYLISINLQILGLKLPDVTTQQSGLCLLLTFMECLVLTALVFYIKGSLNIPLKKILSRT